MQLWVNLKFPPCKFMFVLVASAWLEAAGYGTRVLAAHDPQLITFIFPTLLVLLVPNALALVRTGVGTKLWKIALTKGMPIPVAQIMK